MSEQEKSTSWEAATVDQSVTEQVAQYEQQFHQARAASNAKREANAEQVEWVESVDVTDRGEPTVSRGRQDYENAQNGEELEPELAGGGESEIVAEEVQAAGVEVQEVETEATQDAEAAQEGSSRLESIREQLGLNSQPQQEVSRLDAIQAALTSSPQELER
ncbi:hypothetical protein KX083_004879 [Escherichia coli]|nr:hypothetical protein [Escherichia coli]